MYFFNIVFNVPKLWVLHNGTELPIVQPDRESSNPPPYKPIVQDIKQKVDTG